MFIYEQLTGRLYDPDANLLGIGYAGGDKGHVPAAVNNPSYEETPFTGPLPCGMYQIGQPYDHQTCGLFFIPLTPYPANQMFGRGGFGIHGDLVSGALRSASDGCIILARDVREAIAANPDKVLHVISGFPAADLDSEIAA